MTSDEIRVRALTVLYRCLDVRTAVWKKRRADTLRDLRILEKNIDYDLSRYAVSA